MTDRKKTTAGFWITVALVVVLMGYPLSFGPVWWLADRGFLPRYGALLPYRPLLRYSPEFVFRRITQYAHQFEVKHLPPRIHADFYFARMEPLLWEKRGH
jgi:hypothetical protein